MGNELEFAVAILAIMLTLETFALLCVLEEEYACPWTSIKRFRKPWRRH